MITQSRLDAIKRGVAALPNDGDGWYADIGRRGAGGAVCHTETVRTLDYPQKGICRLVSINEDPISKKGADREALMDFIANARANVPQLVEEVERLNVENAKLRAGCQLGPIVGADTIIAQELELKRLRNDLADAGMSVRRLLRIVRKYQPDAKIVDQLQKWLERKGLQGSVLRESGDTP